MQALLALLAGALLPLGLAPFAAWPLTLVSMGLWFYLLQTNPAHKRGRGALLGWLYGVGKYGVGASWIYVSINVYGNAPPPLAAFLVALFVAGLALFPLVQGWLFCRLRTRHLMLNALWFAALWGAFEWLLTWFLTGFPWLYAGYAHLGTPLAGLAPVGGVLLVGLGAAVSAAFVVAALLGGRRWQALGIAALPWVLGLCFWPVRWVEPVQARSVALVQGNIDQAIKWNEESRLAIERTYTTLSEPHWGVDLMIWPEAAITVLQQRAQNLLEDLDRRGEAQGTALVLGVPGAERLPDGRIVLYNMALAMGDGQGRYRKQRMVPFGEYVPLEGLLRGLIQFFDLPMSDFEPGPPRQPLLQVHDERAAMAICYEIVYGELVRAQARSADVLLTISNDTWFGASIGPLQHLQMAQMRALENGRWLLRGTNNGVTAIVDQRGRITARLPQFEAGVLSGSYQVMRGSTPYTRLGHWPFLLLLAAGVALVLWRGRADRAAADA